MTIIQQPHRFSFSGNILPIVIYSTSAVQFQLLDGSSILINETHTPINNRITIDIKDIVCDNLQAFIPGESDELKIQDAAVKSFTFKIDNATYYFKAIKGGIAQIIDVNNFLENNFLTWQSQIKEITPDSVEFLSYYANQECDVYIRVYTDNGDELTRTIHLTSGHLFNINTSYNIIKSYYKDENIVAYDVSIEASGQRLSYIQRYLLRSSSDKDYIYLFENSIGGFDSLIADGVRITKRKTDSSIVSVKNKNASINKKFDVIYTQNTGFISDCDEAKWLQDLFVSHKVFQLTDKLTEVYIRESDNNYKDDDLNYFSFSFSLTEQSEYNKILQRQTNLTVFDYSSRDLFFLDNRLQDLPLLDVLGEIFIPGVNRDGIIGKVCLNSVIDYITSLAVSNVLQAIPSYQDTISAYLDKHKYVTQAWIELQNFHKGQINVDLSTVWSKTETPNLDKLQIDAQGNLIVSGNIIAFGSSDYVHDMIAALPVASVTSKGIAQFSDIQFTVIDGLVSIKPGVTGLDESALASYLNSHSYATESFVTSRGYLTTHQSLVGYATETWTKANMWTKSDMPNLNKLRIDASGNLIVSGNIIAFGSDNYVHDMIAAMPVASVTSKGIAQFSDTQFAVVNGVVSIKPGVAGLDQSALSSYLNSHSYATESYVTSRGYLTSESDTLASVIAKDNKGNDGFPLVHVVTGQAYLGSRNRTNLTLACINKPKWRNNSGVYYNLATESWVSSRGYLTAHQSLASLALKDHLHSQYLTTHQNLSGYANMHGSINQMFETNRLNTRNTANGTGLSIVGNRIWGSSGNNSACDDIFFGANQNIIIRNSGTFQALTIIENGVSLSAKFLGISATAVNALNIGGLPFRNGNSTNPIHPDSVLTNGMGFTYGGNILGHSDGALYSQNYSTQWGHQMYGDYRTGDMAVRGRNNNTFTPWRKIAIEDTSGNIKISGTRFSTGNVSFGSTLGYATIRSSGNEMCVGNADNSSDIHVNYRVPTGLTRAVSIWKWRNGTATGWAKFNVGDFVSYGTVTASGNITAFSDMRLKKYEKPLDNVLNNINKLSTFYYHWKNTEKYGSDLHLGLSAQTVDLLFPEFVTHGDILSLDYGKLGAVLAVRGLQEVKHWMSKSDKRILELEKEVNNLKKTLGYAA